MTTRSGLVACVAIGVAAAGLAGQSAAELKLERDQDRMVEPGVEGAPMGAPSLHPAAAVAAEGAATAVEEAAEAGRSVSWSKVAHRVGGALIGGWLGYVGAQVVRSDWAKESNGSFRSQRSIWAAVGAVVGVAGSHAIGQTVAPILVPDRVGKFPREQREITTAELREAGNMSAFEVVQRLRPRWLVPRGTQSVSETPRGWGVGRRVVIVPGNEQIIVYLDDVRLGGVAAMRDVASDALTAIRFLNAREATYRYGMGHSHGAIVLSAAVPAP
jgi:hypothetical protein